jgi:hypothetical protein
VEPRALRRLVAAGAGALVLLAAIVVWLAHGRGAAPRAVRAIAVGEARAPAGTRIRVQVLNATRTRGLGRRAALHLRDRGFDVVEVGTAGEQRDTTLVLDRSGHPQWARLVGDALDGAPAATRLDSSRYVDVTVLLGASWRPPAEPFYP